MTNNLYDKTSSYNKSSLGLAGLSSEADDIGIAISKKFVNLEFAIWDLEEFYSSFHNIRRNIIFIECDKIMHDEIVRLISRDERWRSCAIYVGERKPKIINELVKAPVTVSGSGAGGGGGGSGGRFDLSSTGTIVIVHRTDFDNAPYYKNTPEVRFRVPLLERKLVDLLAYALRGWIPVLVSEAVDALKWSFRSNIGTPINIAVLQRYAARRYLGWFMAILLFKLNESKEVENIDPRYIDNGAKYVEALNEVL